MTTTNQESNINSLKEKILAVNLPLRKSLVTELSSLSEQKENANLQRVLEIRKQWESLGNLFEDEQEIEKEYTKLLSEIEDCFQKKNDNLKATEDKCSEIVNSINKLLKIENPDEVEALWEGYQADWELAKPTAPEIWIKKYDDLEVKILQKIKTSQHKQKVEALENIVTELESLKKEEALTLSQKQQRFYKLKNSFKELNLHTGPKVATLRERFSELSNSFQQELGWEKWSGSKRKEGLVQKMETLLNEEGTEGLYEKLQETQKEWKEIGYTSKEDDKLWEQFKKLGDDVFQKVSQLLDSVYLEKTELLKELEQLTNKETTKKNTEAIMTIQEKWKAMAKPLTKDHYKVERNYNKLCTNYFNKRREFFKENKEKQTENLVKKQKLIEDAQRVVKSGDWKDQLPKIKNLQQEWKKIGPVPHKQSDEIWKEFQDLCSPVFEKLRESESEKNAVYDENYNKADEILKQMEEKVQSINDINQLSKELQQLERSLTEVGEIHRSKYRFVESRKAKVFKELDKKELSFQTEKEANLRAASMQKVQLCVKLEGLLENEAWPLDSEKQEKLKTEWNSLGAASQEKVLKKRWKKCVDLMEHGNKDKDFPAFSKEYESNANELELLCVKLERLAGIEPTNFSPAVQKQLMVAELQSKMGKSKQLSKQEESNRIYDEIALIGAVSSLKRSDLDSRIHTAIEKLNA